MILPAIDLSRRNISGKSQPRAQGGDNSVDVWGEPSSYDDAHRFPTAMNDVSTTLSAPRLATDLHRYPLSPVSTAATKTSESNFLSYLLTTLWGRPTVGENA